MSIKVEKIGFNNEAKIKKINSAIGQCDNSAIRRFDNVTMILMPIHCRTGILLLNLHRIDHLTGCFFKEAADPRMIYFH